VHALKSLILLIADAGLELVPKELWRHPSVYKNAEKRGKRPGQILLDTSLHYSAMRVLKDREKRGRPDIVHFCLLEALGSPLNLHGMLNVYVHTVEGKVIRLDPSVRLPRNYNRFVGLMEQLLEVGKVPPTSSTPLVEIMGLGLRDLIKELRPTRIFIFDETGTRLKLKELGKALMREERPLTVVGGFQAGAFSEEVLSLGGDKVSIYPRPLDSWVVVSRILTACECEAEVV